MNKILNYFKYLVNTKAKLFNVVLKLKCEINKALKF